MSRTRQRVKPGKRIWLRPTTTNYSGSMESVIFQNILKTRCVVVRIYIHPNAAPGGLIRINDLIRLSCCWRLPSDGEFRKRLLTGRVSSVAGKRSVPTQTSWEPGKSTLPTWRRVSRRTRLLSFVSQYHYGYSWTHLDYVILWIVTIPGLCPDCSIKLNFCQKRKEVTRKPKKRKSHHHRSKSTDRKRSRLEESEMPGPSVPPQDTAEEEAAKAAAAESIWKEPVVIPELKSREDEYNEYLEDLFLWSVQF